MQDLPDQVDECSIDYRLLELKLFSLVTMEDISWFADGFVNTYISYVNGIYAVKTETILTFCNAFEWAPVSVWWQLLCRAAELLA